MIKKLFTITLLFMFVFVKDSAGIGVKRIVGAAIDATPKVLLSLPSSGSLIATDGAKWIREGSIVGTRVTDLSMVTSIDNGVTWTQPSSPTFLAGDQGFVITSAGTWIQYATRQSGVSFPTIRRSIDNGVTWSIQYICSTCSANEPEDVLTQSSNGRIWLITTAPNTVASWTVMYSDDDGVTWAVSATWSTSGWFTGSFEGLLADGNIVIATSNIDQSLSPAGIYITTNNGTSWTIAWPTLGGFESYRYTSPVKAGSTYYVAANGSTASVGWGIFKSTDGVTWTEHLARPGGNCRYNVSLQMVAFNDNEDDYLFIGCGKSTSPFNITIYYMKLPGTDMVEVYDTGISGGSVSLGNLLFINSTLYFGMDNGNFYKVD